MNSDTQTPTQPNSDTPIPSHSHTPIVPHSRTLPPGVVCIIPARGGSKRIPRKNVKSFCGKPMIAWSIEAARTSGVFDRIIVSTDDDEIAAVAQAHGAEVPFRRPAELANDHATTDEVFLHAVGCAELHHGPVDYACCLYATAPFVQSRYLRDGLALLRERESTSAFTVTSFGYSAFRALKINTRQRVEMFWPEHRLTRSQDLPEAYYDAGQFYWVDVAKYKVEGRIFSGDAVPIMIPRYFVQDIDTPEDWEVAEKMWQVLRMTDDVPHTPEVSRGKECVP